MGETGPPEVRSRSSARTFANALRIRLSEASSVGPYSRLLLASQPLLFSSAHFGFRHSLPVLLISGALPPLAIALAVWQVSRGKVFGELQETSPVIAQLASQTMARARENPEVAGLHASLFWGKNEDVVNPVDYDRDTRKAFREGHDHFSICKVMVVLRRRRDNRVFVPPVRQ